MTNKAKILVVEDEEAIRTGLVDVLIFHGYLTESAEDGEVGLNKALSGQYDLILLDVMLPSMNGFTVCERIRKEDPAQPIIMLTAKTSDEDIIQGLQLGADDYVAKPFSIAQLILRIQAVLRRSGLSDELARTIELGSKHKDSMVKIDTLNLTSILNGKEIHFTRREMDILLYLSRYSDRPVAREELLNKIWGYPKDLNLETRTVDIHIAKLRRKIELDPTKPSHLLTVRGAGYRLMVN